MCCITTVLSVTQCVVLQRVTQCVVLQRVTQCVVLQRVTQCVVLQRVTQCVVLQREIPLISGPHVLLICVVLLSVLYYSVTQCAICSCYTDRVTV